MEASISANISLKQISEIYYNFAVGTGAIGGGIYLLLKTIFSSISALKKRSYINQIKKRYSKQKLNKDFKIVDTDRHPGKTYIIDLKKQEKYWIGSAPTYLDLGFAWTDRVRIQQAELDKYKEGSVILTSEDKK